MPDRISGGAVVRVRLTEVPIAVRRRYGSLLLQGAIKDLDPIAAVDFAAEIHRAVESPSDRAYWVSSSAAHRVLGR